MLVERVKEIVSNFNQGIPEVEQLWHFNYGAAHWQNLKDFPKDEELPFKARNRYLLLLWQDREKIKNEYGATVGYTFTGEFLLMVRSKISDEDYNYKYDTHIKNLYAESDLIDNDFTSCEEWLVKKWKEIEVENVYDTNMDGLKIQFTLTLDLE